MFNQILELYFLPIQTSDVFWISVKMTNLRTKKSYKIPLRQRGLVETTLKNPLSELKIEFGLKQINSIKKKYKFLMGVPTELKNSEILFRKLEIFFLESHIFNEITFNCTGQYKMPSIVTPADANRIIYCIIRGDFKKKFYRKKAS